MFDLSASKHALKLYKFTLYANLIFLLQKTHYMQNLILQHNSLKQKYIRVNDQFISHLLSNSKTKFNVNLRLNLRFNLRLNTKLKT